MRLTQEEIENVNWNDFSLDDIDTLIDLGCIEDGDLVWYYNNTQWRDI